MKSILLISLLFFSLEGYSQKKLKPSKTLPKPKAKEIHVKPEKPGHGNFAVDEEIQEATYLGTEEELVRFFMENIVFSDSAIIQNLEGKITIKFLVDEQGKPIDVVVVKGIGFGIDEQVVTLTPQLKYKPAQIGPTPIKMEQLITIPLRAYRKQ